MVEYAPWGLRSCPSPSLHRYRSLKPLLESASSVHTDRLHTRSRKNHVGYLRSHLHEVGDFNNAPLPISIPLDEIPKDNLHCCLPNEVVVALSETWPRDSSMLSPLVVFR